MNKTNLHDELSALKRRRITEALTATNGNATHAAALLTLPMRTFWDWCGKLEIEPSAYRPAKIAQPADTPAIPQT